MDKKTARARKGLKNIETVEDFENVLEQIMMTMTVVGRWDLFIKTKHIVLGRRKASPFYLQKFLKKGIDLYNMLCYYIIIERK